MRDVMHRRDGPRGIVMLMCLFSRAVPGSRKAYYGRRHSAAARRITRMFFPCRRLTEA